MAPSDRPSGPAENEKPPKPQKPASPGHAGSGNTLGDGRTAGGGENARKRDALDEPIDDEGGEPHGDER